MGTTQGPFLPSLVHIGPVLSEEKIKKCKMLMILVHIGPVVTEEKMIKKC